MILRRLAELTVTFVLITILTFAVSRLAPGDPYIGDQDADAQTMSAWHALHDRGSALAQYGRWLSASLRLDFGRSLVDGRPVRERIAEASSTTLAIAVLALIATFGLGVPLGVWQAKHEAPVVDSALLVLHGVPVFWGGLMLALVAHGLGFATRGVLVLPVVTLVYPGLVRVARYQRAAVRDVLASPAVLLARAKGLPELMVMRRYVLRSALATPLALLASEIPWLLGGSVIVERIFTVPGMGMLAFEAIGHRDIPVIMGVTSVIAVAALASSLLVDLAHAALDPRLR